MNLEEIDEDLRAKIERGLDKAGLNWEDLSEEKQKKIVEGSKALDKGIRSRLGKRLKQ